MNLLKMSLTISTALLALFVTISDARGQDQLDLAIAAPGVPGIYAFAEAGQELSFQVKGPMKAGETLAIFASLPGPMGLGDFDEREAWMAGLATLGADDEYRGRVRVPLALDGFVLQIEAAILEAEKLRSQTYTLVIQALPEGAK
jgi:hypothetical protein